jgi:hypothetical protein
MLEWLSGIGLGILKDSFLASKSFIVFEGFGIQRYKIICLRYPKSSTVLSESFEVILYRTSAQDFKRR